VRFPKPSIWRTVLRGRSHLAATFDRRGAGERSPWYAGDRANQILWGSLSFGASHLTGVGSDTRRVFVDRRRESMNQDKAASIDVARPRAAQLER
jgi:hypothetical protein